MKPFKVLLAISFVFFLFVKLSFTTKADSVINSTLENIDFEEAIVDALDLDTFCSMTKTYFKKYNIVIDKKTKCYHIIDNNIYGVYDLNDYSMFYKYDIATKKYEECKINAIINDIAYCNEKLILVGEENRDACIYQYQKNMFFVNKKYYGGIGYESFKNIKILNGVAILTGLKDGISENSPFANVGNTNSMKPFVITINEKLEIVKDLYINENTQDEVICDIYCNDSFCYFLVKDEKDLYHQYVINENLIVDMKKDLDELKPTLIQIIPFNLNNDILYIYTKNEKMYLAILKDNILKSIHISNYTDFYKNMVEDGKLKILIRDKNLVKKLTINEYHILKRERFIYNQLLNDYKETDHFKVESYFEKLTFIFDDDKNSYINYQESGTYLANYIATRKDGSNILITTEYVIPPFINIVDQGTYSNDYKLLFTDTVLVDGNKKYNGEKIDSLGKHEIIHKSNYYTNIYNIYIYDDTTDMSNNYLDTTFTLYKSTSFYYQLIQSHEKDISKIIMNNKEVDFTISENKILIPIYANKISSIDIYNISKIIYKDNTSIDLNISFTVKTLNDVPSMKIEYFDEELSYNIIDEDKTIADIVIKSYDSNGVLNEEHYKYQSIDYVVPPMSNKFSIFLRYHIGDKNIHEVELGSFDYFMKGKKQIKIKIEIFENSSSSTLKIKNINQSNLLINHAMIQGTDITDAYLKKENKLIIYISVVSSIIITMLFFSYIIIKIIKSKRKIKVMNSNS